MLLLSLQSLHSGHIVPNRAEKISYEWLKGKSFDKSLQANGGYVLLPLKAIGGGPGVKKTCQAYFEELIAVVSMLFTECQNSTPLRR